MGTIRVKDLLLRTIVGINDDERVKKQDVIINLEIKTDMTKAAEADDIQYTLNYRSLTKEIIELVESSEFFLIETLAQYILNIILGKPGVEWARVEIDKPYALRFAKSVSVEVAGSPDGKG